MLSLLELAAEYAIARRDDGRVFFLGAVGVRADGTKVHAKNSSVFDTAKRGANRIGKYAIYKRFPESHAEARLTQKAGFGSVIYVARVARGSGQLAMARPCECCQNSLRAFRVKKVYYTISPEQYGIWDPASNTDMYYWK